ncbi:DUF4056 domain-containing protein, partial [Salmonella enterica subsp. enterica serovar Javiana]|nr:DUF4056 domain-containing protein [Salmonella enterica subsp. enterica serovar Javiana]
LEHNRLPTPVAYEETDPYMLTMPAVVAGYQLSRLGELQIYPGADMQSLPVPKTFYGPSQFQRLADRAKEADKTQLERFQK